MAANRISLSFFSGADKKYPGSRAAALECSFVLTTNSEGLLLYGRSPSIIFAR